MTSARPRPGVDFNAAAVVRGAMLAVLIGASAYLVCTMVWWLAKGQHAMLGLLPAAGLAFAFGWRFGALGLLASSIGTGLWAALYYEDLALGAAAALVSALGPSCALLCLRWINHWKPSEYQLEATLRLIVALCLLSAPLSALVIALTINQFDPAGTASGINVFLGAWLFDAFGALLIGPAFIALLGPRQKHDGWLDPIPLVASFSIIALSFGMAQVASPGFESSLLTFLVPVAAWVAIRARERKTSWTLLCMMLGVLVMRRAQDDPGMASETMIETAILGLVCALVAYLLQAVASDRRIALRRVAMQSRQDLSTGLLNDRGLLAELGERLAQTTRPNYGLIGLHLTNFDALNDLCGPVEALRLEQSVAALLLRQPGKVATARVSAGRYVLIVETEDLMSARGIAREVYSTTNGQIYRTVNGSLRLQASVGGLLVDNQAQINSEDCLVSLAESQAIAASVRDPQLFVEPLSQSMIEARRAHQEKIERIRESIHERRFQIHAQTITDRHAPPGKISYEILIRLLNEDSGLIQPPEFMSLAVQAQMTPAMDRGVIERVFRWLSHNPQAYERTHKCSINLSGLTMSDGTIASYIREQRARYGIAPELIVFEITESEAIRNPAAASRLVDELKADGFGIALDDFGVGLATFEYLKRFPIDFLKIDGSFVRNLINNPIDEEIVLSTVRVARRLNIETVAEHVQDQAIYDRLVSLGVGHFQGEHLGRVLPIDELFRQAAGAKASEPATDRHRVEFAAKHSAGN